MRIESIGRPWARAVCRVVVLCAWATAANALEDVPHTPCETPDAVPAYSTKLHAPAIRVWSALDWRPPACVAWSAGTYRFAVALAAEVPAASADDVLARLGAISTTRGLEYWSLTEQAWRVLIDDAFALTAGVNGAKRGDFSPDEMKAGRALYFEEKDNRSSHSVTYRMVVLEADAGRVIADTSNVDAIRSFGVTFFPPGSLHTFYEFDRLGEGRWGLYLLSAATEDASRLVALGRESYVNRALAAYGHLAKIATPAR